MKLSGSALFDENKITVEKTVSKEEIRKKQETNKGVNTIHITNLSYNTKENDVIMML